MDALGTLTGTLGAAAIDKGGANRLSRDTMNWMLSSPGASKFLQQLGGLTPGSSTFYRFVGTQLPKQVAAYKASQAGQERFNQVTNAQPKSPVALPNPQEMVETK
jgi:hypothetical protein